jgi:hypothetical protein
MGKSISLFITFYPIDKILWFNRVSKNVAEAAGARQKQAKKRSLCVINEHFEPVFNAAPATQVVFQPPVLILPDKASNEQTI